MKRLPAEPPPLHPADLISLFFQDIAQFGEVSPCKPADVPADAVSLLVHHQHMTDAMERFHGTTVQVAVVAIKLQSESYARMSLLTRHPDQQILQLGIVRLCWDRIPQAVRQEVEEAQTPLGRILTEHDVMRSVQFEGLWEFRPRPEIAELMRVPQGIALYGRTARILVHHAPAIELLEIVVLPSGE